jgi:hypothetical protein
MDNSNKIILDLCSGTGAWSKPYSKAGYDVRTITIPENDVRLLKILNEPVYGILAAPPCTKFSRLQYFHHKGKFQDKDFLDALSIVDACFRIIMIHKPKFWALENPYALILKWLGKPRFVFNPCDFGDPYTKKTCLWGEFNIPKFKRVEPTMKQYIKNMPPSIDRPQRRAMTPPGFARAFYEANQ